ncbi:MAG TPA: Rossmann-like and DUF2520 domain-containing protein [Longimicrobiales bacterium]|nr:Rossmann-like and DUF2520 domain-containing protein [Longimicrobiales bacterium]
MNDSPGGVGTVVIIGAGRMGLALGSALRQQEAVERLLYLGRSLEPPPHPLFDPYPLPGDAGSAPAGAEYRALPSQPPAGTHAILLAVPDGALPEVVHDLAMAGEAPPGCVALHMSGALSTDVLAPLHAAGYAIGSLHPLMAVADPWLAGERLAGAAFALGGEPAAVTAGRRIVSALGGLPLVVPPSMRPLYHAAAVMASNYLVALAAAAARLLTEAGVPEEDALPALLPLMRGTLDNMQQLGMSAALTGPIPRGDSDTVRLHLARLSPADRVLYCGLGLELLRLARVAGLDEERAGDIESLLTSD